MFKRQAAPALRQASPRLFFTSEFDWSQLSKDALFDAERCLIICIGDIDAGPHPSVQTSDDNDPYSIVTSVARVAMRWVAADRESTCVVALAPGALPSSVPFEWIVACTACQFTEGASPEECLLALPAKKQSWITRLTSSKAPDVTGRARAFFSAYKDLVEQPGPFTVPILCLRSISIENLPNVDPDRGTRILILVLMNNRIVFSTMQHAGRLSWIKTSGDPACFPVNCMVRGLVTVRAYHVPERMSRDSPRVILFDTDVHTGVAATRDMGVTHQRECMDNVPSSFPAQFSVQVEFSTETDDLPPAGPVVPEDRTDHSEADDYLLALSLQQMVSRESSPDRHESLSPEARIAPSVDQNASRIGSSQGEDLRLVIVSSDDDGVVPYRALIPLEAYPQGSRPVRIPGASQGQIDRLPVFQVPADSPLQAQVCLICKDNFACNDSARTLPCMHILHTSCVTEWLYRRASCPVCLTPLQDH